MLIANETVAEDFYWQEIPFLYRVHETPDPENSRAFSALSRILAITSKETGKRSIPRSFRSFWQRSRIHRRRI